jgi:hypothetical protein
MRVEREAFLCMVSTGWWPAQLQLGEEWAAAVGVGQEGEGPGMMLHQDGSRHQWVPGAYWDLIVTMDDATNEHYSMFFVDSAGQSCGRCLRRRGGAAGLGILLDLVEHLNRQPVQPFGDANHVAQHQQRTLEGFDTF